MALAQLPKRTILIGRSSECDVVINHPEVSGRHAIITLMPDSTVEIKDVGSKNGVYINGKKVLTGILQPGDKLSLGSYTVDWEEILRNPPPPGGGSSSPTRATRIPFEKKDAVRTLLLVIIAIAVVGAILWFFVSPWVFNK